MHVTLPWLNGGKPVEARPVPLNGRRELIDLAMRNADAKAAQQNSLNLLLHGYIIQARKHADKNPIESTRKSWSDSISRTVLAPRAKALGLEWPDSEGVEWLDRLLREFTFQALEAASLEDAEAKLRPKAAEADAELRKHRDGLHKFDVDFATLSLYWHLRAMGIDELTPPGRPPVPLSWARKDREATLEAIGDHGDSGDLIAIQKALAGAPGEDEAPGDAAELEPTTAEVVRGNSPNSALHWTVGSGASTPSSAPATATTAPSETSAESSG